MFLFWKMKNIVDASALFGPMARWRGCDFSGGQHSKRQKQQQQQQQQQEEEEEKSSS